MVPSKRTVSIAIALVFLALVTFLFQPIHPIVPSVAGSSKTIYLVGNLAGGYTYYWNSTNPTITVTEGDTITIILSSSNGAPHRFLLDLDNADGVTDVSDCSATPSVNMDACSSTFSTTSTMVSFTAGTPGTYSYYCTIHYPSMIGTLIVQGLPKPDYSLSSNPTSLTILQGSSENSTITVTGVNGFSGTISLSALASPTGPTTLFYPATVPISSSSATSIMKVSITSSVSPGTYTVTVSGNNGTVIRTTTVSVTVTAQDFTITTSPTSLNIPQNSTSASTITLSSLYGLSGNLNLTATVSPSGPTLSFSKTTVTLVSGGTVQSVLTVSTVGGPNNSVAPGTYSVNVTVTSGTLSHWKTIQTTVNPPITPAPPLPLLVLAGAGVIIVAAVSVTVFVVRRRAK